MDLNEHKIEEIERYIREDMSDAERTEFESELSSNSALREEYYVQKDIITALRQERMMAMKSRLNAIEVGGGWTGGQLVASISGGIAVVASIVYFSGIMSTEAPQESIVLEEENAKVEEVISDNEQIESSPEDEEVIAVLPEEKESENDLVENIDSELVESDEEIAESTPELQSPEMPNTDFDDPSVSTNEEVQKLDRGKKRLTSKVDVEINVHKKYNFHYQYYNNKLHLYGDFSSSPYELLELNSDKGKDLYLFFDGKYYALENTTEVTKLSQLRNKIIIRGLDNLR